MIRIPIIISIIGLLFFLIFIMGFRVIDAAIEIDGLKSQIKLQQKSIKFLETLGNYSHQRCGLNVTILEGLAKESGYYFFWEGETGLVGPFKVIRKGSYIEKIYTVGL